MENPLGAEVMVGDVIVLDDDVVVWIVGVVVAALVANLLFSGVETVIAVAEVSAALWKVCDGLFTILGDSTPFRESKEGFEAVPIGSLTTGEEGTVVNTVREEVDLLGSFSSSLSASKISSNFFFNSL